MTKEDSIGIEQLKEAHAILKALSPKRAPDGVNVIMGSSGLRIMKSDHMPANTVIVSKELFDVIFGASERTEGRLYP